MEQGESARDKAKCIYIVQSLAASLSLSHTRTGTGIQAGDTRKPLFTKGLTRWWRCEQKLMGLGAEVSHLGWLSTWAVER